MQRRWAAMIAYQSASRASVNPPQVVGHLVQCKRDELRIGELARGGNVRRIQVTLVKEAQGD